MGAKEANHNVFHQASPQAARLLAAGEIVLTPSFKKGDGDGVGKVQTAVVWAHGQADASIRAKVGQHFIRETAGFRAKDENVAFLVLNLVVARGTLGGGSKKTVASQRGTTVLPIFMHLHLGVFMVIQTGAAHFGVIEREAQRLDQMQCGTGIGGQTNDVAGIGWDFGLKQDNVEHDGLG